MQSPILTTLVYLVYALRASSFIAPLPNTLHSPASDNHTFGTDSSQANLTVHDAPMVPVDQFVSLARTGIDRVAFFVEDIVKVVARLKIEKAGKIVGLQDVIVYGDKLGHWREVKYSDQWKSETVKVLDDHVMELDWTVMEHDAIISLSQAHENVTAWTRQRQYDWVSYEMMVVTHGTGWTTYEFLYYLLPHKRRLTRGCVSIYNGAVSRCDTEERLA